MEDIRRLAEYEDRLAEVEHALPGLRERGGDAARYLRLEMERLAGECRERRDRWSDIVRRAEGVLSRLDDPPM
jgi:hypothetical protein